VTTFGPRRDRHEIDRGRVFLVRQAVCFLTRIPMSLRTIALLGVALALAGCRKDAANNPEPASTATIHSSQLELPPLRGPAPGAINTVDVGDDRAVLVVVGEGAKSKQPIVHLTGMCTEAKSDLEAWSSTVRNYGTIIALEGDVPCPDGRAGRSWSMNIERLEQRIHTAIDAVRSVRGVDLDDHEVILMGESMGATRAIALAGREPQKYRRLVVIGAPEKLNPTKLENVKGFAVLIAEKEPPAIPQQNYDAASAAGLRTKQWTLTGADHGDYGPNGATIMDEALAFVTR
jgi:predicted esterase